MRFFMIEWWDISQSMYKQEYFVNPKIAFARFQTLADDVNGSRPEISTLHMEDE